MSSVKGYSIYLIDEHRVVSDTPISTVGAALEVGTSLPNLNWALVSVLDVTTDHIVISYMSERVAVPRQSVSDE